MFVYVQQWKQRTTWHELQYGVLLVRRRVIDCPAGGGGGLVLPIALYVLLRVVEHISVQRGAHMQWMESESTLVYTNTTYVYLHTYTYVHSPLFLALHGSGCELDKGVERNGEVGHIRSAVTHVESVDNAQDGLVAYKNTPISCTRTHTCKYAYTYK